MRVCVCESVFVFKCVCVFVFDCFFPLCIGILHIVFDNLSDVEPINFYTALTLT